MRVCITCQTPKDEGCFRIYSKSKNLRKQCKTCDGQDAVRWMRQNPERTMLNAARKRAKEQGIPFAITVSDIVIPKICPVLRHPFEQGTRAEHDWSPSLDRKIPQLGYVPGNVQVISYKANRLKSDASIADLKRLIRYMRKTEL